MQVSTIIACGLFRYLARILAMSLFVLSPLADARKRLEKKGKQIRDMTLISYQDFQNTILHKYCIISSSCLAEDEPRGFTNAASGILTLSWLW